MLIYKIFRPSEWSGMQARGETAGSAADIADGFVHFSTAAQLPGTLAKHFAGEPDLILLACDADAFGAELRWEPARGGSLFAHLYRPLRLDDLVWTRPLPTGGTHRVPGDLD